MSPHPVVPHDLLEIIIMGITGFLFQLLLIVPSHRLFAILLSISDIMVVFMVMDNNLNRMRNYNEQQSSESDVEIDDHLYKATTGYGKIAKIVNNQRKYGSSSESEESLTSQEEEEQQSPKPRSAKKEGYRVGMDEDESDSESQESERGIDHIQLRIRKLQNDLQKKIDKHKKESSAIKPAQPIKSASSEKINAFKNNSSPPLPKKIESKSTHAVYKPPSQQKNGKAAKESKEVEQKQKEDAPVRKQSKNLPQITEEKRQAKESSPKKKPKQKKQAQQQKPTNIEKRRVESKPNPKVQSTNDIQQKYIKKLSKANKHIQDLTRALEETRKQNKRLRDQLQSKKNKKMSAEVQKLREINSLTENAGQVKLQKEIQLLKIIENLQAKLKKSINKKLNKSRAGSTSAALLHKGLPSSLLN